MRRSFPIHKDILQKIFSHYILYYSALRLSGKQGVRLGRDVCLAEIKKKFSEKISTHLLIMEVDFCPALCIPEMPVLQAFWGISHFVWYCKAVSDLS